MSTQLPTSQQQQEEEAVVDQFPYTQYQPQHQLAQVLNAEPRFAVALVTITQCAPEAPEPNAEEQPRRCDNRTRHQLTIFLNSCRLREKMFIFTAAAVTTFKCK